VAAAVSEEHLVNHRHAALIDAELHEVIERVICAAATSGLAAS
jgi:hypothetical protein